MRLPGLPPIPSLTAGPNEDEWGYDPDFAKSVEPWLDFLYTRWWRVVANGLEHIPARGPALIVANHAGVVPWDAAMMATAIRRSGGGAKPLEGVGPPRHPRFLVLDWAFSLPWASTAIRRFGGVPASPHNALALLRQGHVVMVFPEGAKGVGKPYNRRYRLERFGRGGFVELALRADAPIVPCAVVGSEEIYPKIGELPLLARLTGAPYFPLTPTFPWLGPLGLIPLPSKWYIEFGEPIQTASHSTADADDAVVLFDLTDRVRETIQATLYRLLVQRRSVWR
jgi:1-acyl-sn-glycerol-3-phosphate acyltransferase